MVWVVIAARCAVGLVFFVFGLNGFLNFIAIPPPPTAEAGSYIGLLHMSKYLYAVKVLEVIGGALLLSGRLVPVGITLLMPVAVNVMLYELCLAHAPGIGCGLVLLLAFLVWGYWPYFAAVFTIDSKVRGGRI